MTTLQRQRVAWSGFPGGPGLSTFYFVDAAAHQAALHTFFEALVNSLPSDVYINIEPSGDEIDVATGALTGSWTGAAIATTVGASSGSYAAPAGYQFTWLTDITLSGRRLRGRTFIVPAAPAFMQTDGSLLDTSRAALTGFGNSLVAAVSGNMMVWQRPRAATPQWTDVHGVSHPAKAARAGGNGIVTAATVPDKVVVLRSRRD